MVARVVRAMTLKCAAERRGFTLLELLLVLAMMAVAATLLLPNLGAIDNRQFDAQVRELQALLNNARRMAVVRGVDASVELLVEEPSTAEDHTAPRSLIVGRWQPDNLVLRYSAESWQHDSTLAQQDGRLLITFFPEGGSTGGRLQLSQDGREVQLLIDALTGRVERQQGRP